MNLRKSVRITKKVLEGGVWKFIALRRNGLRYIWDDRPGAYFLDWWEEGRRRREFAGKTPSQALTAQRRKQNEVVGSILINRQSDPSSPQTRKLVYQSAVEEPLQISIAEARRLFSAHVVVHSPDKPETVRRYAQALTHFERLLGHRKFVEAITRADIDDYKTKRCQEKSERTGRIITAQTVNFELGVFRTFFYYLIQERDLKLDNPCEKFKKLRDAKQKSRRRPPTYDQEELDALFTQSDEFERSVFATLLLTGLRKRELYFLAWPDIDFRAGLLRVTGDGKQGFSPKDYEIREIPLPPDLMQILRTQPRRAPWVFPNRNGGRLTHLLRRLKTTAERAGVMSATLHKFRHTYCTRLLETGADIVTVQKLMGHSDIQTTMRYLNPRDELKHSAAERLSLGASPKKTPRKNIEDGD